MPPHSPLPAFSGPIRTARALVAEHGAASLWRGLGPTIARVFFGAGIYFSSIHALSDALKSVGASEGSGGGGTERAQFRGEGGGAGTSGPPVAPQPQQGALSDTARAFIAGFTARTLAATLLSPIAVVKTRMEWTAREALPYRTTAGGVAHIARAEGISALYAGLIPTLARDSPFSGVYYTIYSKLKAMFVCTCCRSAFDLAFRALGRRILALTHFT